MKYWYLKGKNQKQSMKCFQAKWKLFRSIHVVQEMKLKQQRLIDNCVFLSDLYTLQRHETDQIEKIIQQTNTMKIMINKIEEKFIDINRTMNNIQYKLDRFV